MSDRIAEFKRLAAERAVTLVKSGMVLGLGHGSTAGYAIDILAHSLEAGDLHSILAIPASESTAEHARSLRIPLTGLDQHSVIDLTIDGADEVDPHLNLIKGGGGALLREKVIAQATRREVIVADQRKLTEALGSRFPLPVEVVPFARGSIEPFLRDLGAEVKLREEVPGEAYRTDQGNWILDCEFGPILDPAALAARLEGRAGIVEHGLFIGLAHEVIVGGEEGLKILTKSETV